MFNSVIIRYGEIFLKSEFVKKRFEEKLIKDIRGRIGDATLLRRRHRIYIETDRAIEVSERLRNVFGIVSVSPAKKIRADMRDITKAALDLAGKVLKPGASFAVRAERSGKHDFSSRDIETMVGKQVLESTGCRVDLKNPGETIYVEVRDEVAFIFDKKMRGLRGLPYKTQGRVVALISTGIDSPVAAWMMMRRGCEIIALHFGEEDINEVLAKLRFYAGGEIKTYVIPYDSILERISRHADRYTCIVCKRFMHRVAGEIAGIENAEGVVTGDNLGQVASQTLENLKVINCLDIPVYRPLVGFDKEDIIGIARDIGTYGLVKKKRCCFVPRKPVTRSREEVIAGIEEKAGINELMDDVRKNLVHKKGYCRQ